jgi:RimJ/RimL family protein N-acetyltransferase
MLTERLEVRPAVEADRARFVALFQDPAFMEFSDGAHDLRGAHGRFDELLSTVEEVPFAKQPVIERATDTIVGYSGVAWFTFEGERRLEYGYRLVPEARGRGYATEAGQALVSVAAETFDGELLAMIDPRNTASSRVITKLGFEYWKRAEINGFEDDLYRRSF